MGSSGNANAASLSCLRWFTQEPTCARLMTKISDVTAKNAENLKLHRILITDLVNKTRYGNMYTLNYRLPQCVNG